MFVWYEKALARAKAFGILETNVGCKTSPT